MGRLKKFVYEVSGTVEIRAENEEEANIGTTEIDPADLDFYLIRVEEIPTVRCIGCYHFDIGDETCLWELTNTPETCKRFKKADYSQLVPEARARVEELKKKYGIG